MVDVNRNNLYIGRPFHIEPQGNAKHCWNNRARSGNVTRIGRKYFYVSVDGFSSAILRFEVDGGEYAYEQNGDCNAKYILHDSEEAFLKHIRADAEKKSIRRYVCDTPFDRFPDEVASAIFETLLENGLVSPIEEGDRKV